MIESPYKTPHAVLVDHSDLPPLDAGVVDSDQLRRAAYVCVAYIVSEIPLLGFSFALGADIHIISERALDMLSLVNTALYIYVFLVFKSWLRKRFDFPKADLVLNLVIGLNLISAMMELFTPDAAYESVGWNIAFAVLLFTHGVFTIALGLILRRLPFRYPYMRALATFCLISGACFVTVVLFIVAIPFSIVAEIILAQLLFYAAREANASSISQER